MNNSIPVIGSDSSRGKDNTSIAVFKIVEEGGIYTLNSPKTVKTYHSKRYGYYIRTKKSRVRKRISITPNRNGRVYSASMVNQAVKDWKLEHGLYE